MMMNLALMLTASTIICLSVFILQRQHLLMALLSLEATILTLALFFSIITSSPSSMELFYCLIILTFGACEASVALALLVIMARSYGNDQMSLISLSKC